MQYTSYELLWLFFIYSVLGWAVGVVIAAVKRKKFVNTGVLSLPMCPVYGFGAVLNAIFLTDLKSAPVFLAIGGAVLSSFLVVVTGVVLEHIFTENGGITVKRSWDSVTLRFRFCCCTVQQPWENCILEIHCS